RPRHEGGRSMTEWRLTRLGALALAALLCLAAAGQARAADKLRVGKAILNSFTFGLLDVGIKNGNFAKAGLDIEAVVFTGATRLQQAMTTASMSSPALAKLPFLMPTSS